MSFLKNLMRPFVEFEQAKERVSGEPAVPRRADSSKDQPAQANTSDRQASSPENIYPSTSAASSAPVALVEYQKHFEDLIEEANASNPIFQGADFKEFIDSKADVRSIPDETTRYNTAFNILRRAGLTKEKLLRTGQEYIRLIESDLKGFEGAYVQKYKTDVEQKEQLLKGKEEELQALNKKISLLREETLKLTQEIKKSKEQLDTNKQAFFLAGENKKNEIQSELQRIEQHFL